MTFTDNDRESKFLQKAVWFFTTKFNSPVKTGGLGKLNDIKVWVFFEKNIKKKHLCYHEKNYCYFCKSNIPVINLIVSLRNMIKLSKNMSLQKIR